MTLPFPASGTYIQSIKDTSRLLRQKAGISNVRDVTGYICALVSNLQITTDAIKRLLLSPSFTTSFKRVSASHGLALPLNFSSPLDELNLLSILSLLNFASGYRVQLHEAVGRGAWDSIRAFAFSLYLSSSIDGGDLLSAKGLSTIDATKVAELMGVDIHVERPHATIPGLIIGELGGPLHELVGLISDTLTRTGKILVQLGYPNLGAFVAEALKEGAKVTDATHQLEVILERLVRAIPAFQDMAEVDGQAIYCFKKALFLIHATVVRFAHISPSPFPTPSTAQSPVFTDNVLPSLLIHLGVIDLSASPTLSSLFPDAGSPESLESLLGIYEGPENKQKAVPKEGPILRSDQAYILRAAAIDACELIVKVARTLPAGSLPDDGSLDWLKEINLPDLDMWIWTVAKDRSDYRQLERFVLKDTVFF